MKRVLASMTATLAVVMISAGCGFVRAPVVPPTGLLFTDIKAPLDHDYGGTQASGLRTGTSESMSILGLVALGDASTNSAARSANLQTIHYADYEYFNILGVYQRYRTVVHGE